MLPFWMTSCALSTVVRRAVVWSAESMLDVGSMSVGQDVDGDTGSPVSVVASEDVASGTSTVIVCSMLVALDVDGRHES